VPQRRRALQQQEQPQVLPVLLPALLQVLLRVLPHQGTSWVLPHQLTRLTCQWG
jgi:hypothetical protein